MYLPTYRVHNIMFREICKHIFPLERCNVRDATVRKRPGGGLYVGILNYKYDILLLLREFLN